MTVSLTGIGISRGIAIGKAHLIRREDLQISEYVLPRAFLEDEVERYDRALRNARRQLEFIRDQIRDRTPADITAFIDMHLLMLEDASLAEAPKEYIRRHGYNAEWALKLQRDALIDSFENMEDPYLRGRKDDVDHVVRRIQRLLVNEDEHVPHTAETSLKGRVLFAEDLTPADMLLVHHQGVIALVTEHGGPTSHTAILARSLGIPAVMGLHRVLHFIREHEQVVIDGEQGAVLANVDAGILDYYRRRREAARSRRRRLSRLKGAAPVTRNGQRVSLLANIELSEDIDAAKSAGAEGVGLYRTEFLYLNRETPPDEEEQLENYRGIVNAMDGLPVTIRTLDLGLDKQPPVAWRLESAPTANPALGLRAVRLCLKDPDLFRPQLRAILRASAFGQVRMMIPMLSSIGELKQVMRLLEETRQELTRAGVAYDPAMPVGGMIEVPASAVIADHFARHLDFLSIGTNDLIQYTLAIDRVDDEVNYLYDPLHPAVLRLIQTTLKAGRACGIPVGMCGEMAGEPRLTRLLLGMGLDEFSMHPATMLEVKRIITETDTDQIRDLVDEALQQEDPATTLALNSDLRHY